MPDYGFTPPPPPIVHPPRPAATLNDLRLCLGQVDFALAVAGKDSRTIFTAKDIINLLLDIRNTLDRLTSTTTLLSIAVELNDETRALKEAFNRDSSDPTVV